MVAPKNVGHGCIKRVTVQINGQSLWRQALRDFSGAVCSGTAAFLRPAYGLLLTIFDENDTVDIEGQKQFAE